MDKKFEYYNKLQVELLGRLQEIEELARKASEAKEAAQALLDKEQDYEEQINVLLDKQEKAKVKLEELKNSDDSTWENLKAGVELAFSEIKDNLKHLVQRDEKGEN